MTDKAKPAKSASEKNGQKQRNKGWDNLKPFQPGQSGNPGGRPKKKWITEVVEEMLAERMHDPEYRQAFKDQMWAKLQSQKVVGAMTLDKVWERTEGKVADQLQVTGDLALTISDRLARARERTKK